MKILQICPAKLPLIDEEGRIFGGGQKSCLEIAKMLTRAGHTVTSLVNPDTFTAWMAGEALPFDCRKQKEELIDLASKHDLVIFHLIGQSGLNTLSSAGIPAIMIWHVQVKFLGISKYGMFESIAKNRRAGGKLIGVSKHVEVALNEEIRKTEEFCQRSPEKYGHYLPGLAKLSVDDSAILQYWDPEEELPRIRASNGRGVLVSRADAMRNPKPVVEALGEAADYFLSFKDPEDEYVLSMGLDELSSVKENYAFDRIQRLLPHYKVLINPCVYETAGYSVFEAACLGLPSILCTDKSRTHASSEFLPEFGYKLCEIPSLRGKAKKEFWRSLGAMVEETPDDLELRTELQAWVTSQYTMDRAYDAFMATVG